VTCLDGQVVTVHSNGSFAVLTVKQPLADKTTPGMGLYEGPPASGHRNITRITVAGKSVALTGSAVRVDIEF
jgi:hypothetical protein